MTARSLSRSLVFALREVVPEGGVRTHEGSALSWSPDGSWIAFGTQDQYRSLIDPDGTGLVKPLVDVGNAPINGVFGQRGRRMGSGSSSGPSIRTSRATSTWSRRVARISPWCRARRRVPRS
jgi:hypothetical protein